MFTNSAGRQRTQKAQTQMSKWFIKEDNGGGGVENLVPNTPTWPWLVFVSLTSGICYNLLLVSFSISYSSHFAFSSAHQEELAGGSRQFLASLLLSLSRVSQALSSRCRWGPRKQKIGTMVKEQPPFLYQLERNTSVWLEPWLSWVSAHLSPGTPTQSDRLKLQPGISHQKTSTDALPSVLESLFGLLTL